MTTAPQGTSTTRSRRTERVRPTRQETRLLILDAAIAVFGERGIAASSLNDVAAAAGLTKGAVYSSFASKDDLVLALMEHHAAQRLAASLAAVSTAGDPHVLVQSVARVLVQEMHSDAAWHRLLAEYFAMSYRDPRIKEALRERRGEARAAVKRGLDSVAELLDFEWPLPTEEVAVLFFALSNGLAVESGIDPDAVPDDLLAKVLSLIAPDAIRIIEGTTPVPTDNS